MFEPEYENITCPKCYHREVYFDRQMGHYCMFCGHQFSTEAIEALLEYEVCHMIAEGECQAVTTGKRGEPNP